MPAGTRVHAAPGDEPPAGFGATHTVIDGVSSGACFGTTLHGIFDGDGFRQQFLTAVAARRGKRWVSDGVRLEDLRQAAVEHLADVLDEHLDLAAIERLIASPPPRMAMPTATTTGSTS